MKTPRTVLGDWYNNHDRREWDSVVAAESILGALDRAGFRVMPKAAVTHVPLSEEEKSDIMDRVEGLG